MFNPLQISNYIATVLNGGTHRTVTLLKEVRTYSGEVVFKNQTEIVSTIALSSEAVSTVKQGMRQMVQYDAAASYYMNGIPVTVGGKTGTAQRGAGKNDNRFFVCAAPYNNPDIIVSVIIEPDDTKDKDNVYGSSYASYAAAETLKAYYKVK
jgi:penicillin-binding protein 2